MEEPRISDKAPLMPSSPDHKAPQVERDIVTADEVVAEVNRIAEIVRFWPPELQVVSAREDRLTDG